MFNKNGGGYNINNVKTGVKTVRFPNFHNQLAEQRNQLQGSFYPVGGRRSSIQTASEGQIRRPRIRKRLLRRRQGRN